MSGAFKFKAFISYSHTDVKWAKWLHRTLETYRTPRRLQSRKAEQGESIPSRLSPVFRDREEFATSHNLSESIRIALEQSENLIVICSPQAAASKWVNQEIESFKKQGRQQKIYYLIVAGDPAATGSEQDCFPPAVHQSYDAAGNATDSFIDPIAADAREQGDGKALARLTIIAGLLGVGLDDLRQREQQRKNRRLAIISASSVFASIVTVGLAINATLARDEAERRQQQAEELLGFMVGDLRSSLEPIGRLDLLEGVGQQAMEYFQTVSVSDLTEGELLRQAQVLTQLGEIRFNQLKYEEALASFTEAFERSFALQRLNRENADRLFNRSQAEFWVGFVHWRIGNLSNAREWMVHYRDSAFSLYAMQPANDNRLREVAYGYHNISVLDQESGQYDDAVEGFKLEIEILNELISRNPSIEAVQARADAYSWIGNIAILQGNLDSAISNYRDYELAMRELLVVDPKNVFLIDKLGFAVQLVAEALSLSGNLEEALRSGNEAASIFDDLLAIDNSNSNYQRLRARPMITLGNIYASRGEFARAREMAEKSIQTLEYLLESGNADHNIHSQLSSSYLLLAWIEKETANQQLALDAINSSLHYISLIDNAGRLNNERVAVYASVLVMQGEIQQSLGLVTQARSAWESAEQLLTNLTSLNESPLHLDPMLRILAFTDRVDSANSINKILQGQTYFPLRPWPIF